MPLGSKLKEITGYDVMSIDLSDMVKRVTIPAFFLVTESDNVSGKADVINLHANYGGMCWFDSAQKKLLKIDQGEHNSERPIETIRECVAFLNDNFGFRVDQGLHDLSKVTEIEEAKFESTEEMMNRDYEQPTDEPEHKSLLDMILDSQRDSIHQKIQIASRLRLFSGSNADNITNTLNVDKVAVEDLDESMMELSQQVEVLMATQNTAAANKSPITKLKTLSERDETHIGGIHSPDPLSIKCMEDGLISDLKIITPFAIQTKASKQ